MKFGAPRPLEPSDELGEFQCGDEGLDEWLKKYAMTNHKSGSARVFVVEDPEQPKRIVAYYCFSSSSIERARATDRAAKTMPDPVPGFLVGRLAVHKDFKGSGLGKGLLRDVIARAVRLSEEIASRVIIVHALNEDAMDFYRHFEFESSPLDDLHLMLLMKDAKAIVNRP